MSTPGTAVHRAGGPTGRPGGARRRPPSRQRRRKPVPRRRRASDAGQWLPLLLVAVAVFAGLAWDRDSATGSPAVPAVGCTVSGTSVTLTAEQLANATTIAEAGRSRGLPDRAIVIALATALQESGLRNLDHGDRDSLGLFQQRPSQGWGTEEEVQDPAYATGKFYDHLVRVPGWESGRLTDVAQSVQRSAFPEAYQKHEAMATELTAALVSSAVLDCR